MKNVIDIFTNLDDSSKKLIKKFSIGLVVVVILIIVAVIIFNIIGRKDSYVTVENKLAEAAYKYYQANPGLLPNADVKTQIVSADTLANEGYMKELKKYTKNESCSGNVVVSYFNGEYDYQGFLNCNDFTSELLVDKIKNQEPIVESGQGLYQEADGTLRFRGEFVNNWVLVGTDFYRIIKIDSENKIYLLRNSIKTSDEEKRSYWDDRYNNIEDSSCGINDYTISRIKESLTKVYDNLDPQLKNKTVGFDLCIGRRSLQDTTTDGSVECATKYSDQKIGLISLYEYIRASIDSNCNGYQTKDCKNYNYMIMDTGGWWTLTPISDNTTSAFYISTSGNIDKDKGNNKKIMRYVVAIKPNTLFKSGVGTREKPYVFR